VESFTPSMGHSVVNLDDSRMACFPVYAFGVCLQ
jgi:hypothetical protein